MHAANLPHHCAPTDDGSAAGDVYLDRVCGTGRSYAHEGSRHRSHVHAVTIDIAGAAAAV